MIFGFLLLANAPFINKFILFKVDNNSFAYSNINGSYTNRESFGFKDPTFTGFSFDYYIQEYDPPEEARVLYRIYKINPICFWRWKHYIYTSLKYKYMDWEKIEKRREIDKNKIIPSGYQEFW